MANQWLYVAFTILCHIEFNSTASDATSSKREFLKMVCAGSGIGSLSGVSSAEGDRYVPDIDIREIPKRKTRSLYETVSVNEAVRGMQKHARTVGTEFNLKDITGYTLTENGKQLHNLRIGLKGRDGSVDIRVSEDGVATLLTVDQDLGVDAYVSTNNTVSTNSLSGVMEYTEWQDSTVQTQDRDWSCDTVNIGYVCDFFQVLAAAFTIVITILQPQTVPFTITASQLIGAGCTLGDFLPVESDCDISTVDFCTRRPCFDDVGVIHCATIPEVDLKLCQ